MHDVLFARVRRAPVAAALATLLATAGPASPTAHAADGDDRAASALATVDLARYMGRWYVIAMVPDAPGTNERTGDLATRFEWKLRPDGKIDDSFYGRHGSFTAPEKTDESTATVVPGSHNAQWRVRHLLVTVPQSTLYVDPAYRTTVIERGGGGQTWVLARERTIDDATYRKLTAIVAKAGVDASRLRKVAQEPYQVDGAPPPKDPPKPEVPGE